MYSQSRGTTPNAIFIERTSGCRRETPELKFRFRAVLFLFCAFRAETAEEHRDPDMKAQLATSLC